MEYLGYFIGGFVSFVFAVVIAVLQTNNNRKYNEFKKLEEKVNDQDKQIAVNTNSDEKIMRLNWGRLERRESFERMPILSRLRIVRANSLDSTGPEGIGEGRLATKGGGIQ